jgi:hypothetical protein
MCNNLKFNVHNSFGIIYQVVEVSGFNEHLLTECEAKEKFSQCPRCEDVLLTVDLDEHSAENTCTGTIRH